MCGAVQAYCQRAYSRKKTADGKAANVEHLRTLNTPVRDYLEATGRPGQFEFRFHEGGILFKRTMTISEAEKVYAVLVDAKSRIKVALL